MWPEFIPLFDVVKSWTKETAPQNVKDFPLFPESLFELLDTMESAQSEIEITDSTLTWKSNLLELLPKDQTGAGTTERLFGYLGSNGEMQYATFESVGNGTYTVPVSYTHLDVYKRQSSKSSPSRTVLSDRA